MTTFAADASDPHAVGPLVATVLLRMVLLPFFHPLMAVVSATGIIAVVGERGRGARVGLALCALLVAIALHGIWDWSGLVGSDPLLIFEIYGAVLVPVFVTMLILALVLRRRAGKTVAASLPALARDGHIDPVEVSTLASLGQRRRWRRTVRRRWGRSAARATARYQAEASRLGIRATHAQATGHGEDALDDQAWTVAEARADLSMAITGTRGSVEQTV